MREKNQVTKEDNIEVWADLVNIRHLVFALVLTSAFTLGAYFIAPNEEPKPLYFGLIGSLIGFIISSMVIKPKRKFKTVENGEA
ncbi:hypothetical protein BN1058_02803 [Paraliobacillus sp. PM-2]|uniref:hypothetical protein n=1 Tax=Paraliobacillus sp. PM-2 TaxID=1462524 RepID=UPI00061C22A3|nr:hypothetical protein [Paraliobacillus sp. PM-2]CQR48434.1 hypothetical protein BN1058_02803 [Paraliobacillus sp. PM-2]